jgi:type III secretion protein W
MAELSISRGAQGINVTLEAMKQVAKEEQIEQKAEQQESQGAFLDMLKDAINPFAARVKSEKSLKTRKGQVKKSVKAGEKSQRLLPIERIKDFAEQFQRRNPELKANTLSLLRDYIKPGDSKETILKKVREFYPDVSLADEALEFLLATTEGELNVSVQDAQQDFNGEFGREIAAGRNISAQARQAAEKGLGTPTSLRDLYRDITATPRESSLLFEELANRYSFKELKKVIDFLLHSLGADMKSKGPSIPRGLLHRLFTETRSLQAILGVYRFFKGRMSLMEKLFDKEGLEIPNEITFESMAKQFMTLAAERYPSASKVLQTAAKLGIDKWLIAKIIVFSQLRDAIREVAMFQIYKSLQHRDELYMAIIEALEDLEDQLEEEEKDKEEDEKEEDEDEDEEDEE